MAHSKSKPFQLLEINITSAQDLAPKAWVNPSRKLLSCVDTEGNNNPSWNDKFVFRVDEDFLMEDTSAVMIEIYASHWLRDVIMSTVRVLVGNLIPPPVLSNHHIGMRFVALQVRRPSGRPQGILNMGVALLDGSLSQEGASAVGYRDIMQDPTNKNDNQQQAPINLKPILRRSRSERSEHIAVDNYSPNSSIVVVPTGKNKRHNNESSILSISEFTEYSFKGMPKVGKASSVISGAELINPKRPKGKKSGSVISDSIYSKESSRFYRRDNPDDSGNKGKNQDDEKLASNGLSTDEMPKNKVVDKKSITTVKGVVQNPGQAPRVKDLIAKFDVHDNNAPKGLKNEDAGLFKGNSIWSDSDVGPSASEVAAMMAERRHPLNDNQSSVLDGWSVDESVEGLRSKLERWRMDLPPVYDNGYSSSSYKSSVPRNRGDRKRSGGGSGMFSCFGNICGYECQFVFGNPSTKRIRGSRYTSSSVGSAGAWSYV